MPGFGSRFRDQIGVIIERMSATPLQFPIVYKNVRRALLRRFPYMLFFTIDGETLLVIACFHSSRDPRIWRLGSRRVCKPTQTNVCQLPSRCYRQATRTQNMLFPSQH